VTPTNFVKSKKIWTAIALMLIVSPLFGVILADVVGYHEPLDVAAEAAGLRDVSEEITWTPFFDYGIPGLPSEVGYAMAGALGVAVIVVVGYVAMKVVERRRGGHGACLKAY